MCSPPFLDTNYYLFNQTDLERHRQLRESVSCSTEVCSCLLPIASASFHLHHTFLLLVPVRAHIYLQRCSLTENTLTSFPLCIDSGLLKHLFFFPQPPQFFFPLFLEDTHKAVIATFTCGKSRSVRPWEAPNRVHASAHALIGEGFARGRIVFIIPPACVEMKVKIYKETRGKVSFLSEVSDAENSCSHYEIMSLLSKI